MSQSPTPKAFSEWLRALNAAIGRAQSGLTHVAKQLAQQRMMCRWCGAWHRPGLPMQVHLERAHGVVRGALQGEGDPQSPA